MTKRPDWKTAWDLSRRQFLFLAAGAGAITGCRSGVGDNQSSATSGERIVNAGPAARYAGDGVYGNFQGQGFFVVRKDGKLRVYSAICTHKKCKLAAEPDHSFYCKCHGSTFDPDGKVLNGPAKRDLPMYPASVDEQGNLLVKVPGA